MKCASIAAQVAQATFYLEVLERYLLGEEIGPVDWGEIWRTMQVVKPGEWAGLGHKLKQTYERISGRLRGLDSWEGEAAILVYSACHLGEIRQALCTFKA